MDILVVSFQAKLFQINEEGLGVVVTSFKGGADGKGLRDAVESVVDDLEKVLLWWWRKTTKYKCILMLNNYILLLLTISFVINYAI